MTSEHVKQLMRMDKAVMLSITASIIEINNQLVQMLQYTFITDPIYYVYHPKMTCQRKIPEKGLRYKRYNSVEHIAARKHVQQW